MPTKTRPYYFDNRYWYVDSSSGTSSQPIRVGDYSLIGNQTVSTDANTKGRNYRYLISNGLNATTGLTGTTILKTCQPGAVSYRADYVSGLEIPFFRYDLYGNITAYYLGSASTNLVLANSFLNAADNQARMRFYSNLASVNNAFKGMVFTGELKESLRMIRNPAQSLRKGISDYLDRLKKDGPRKSRRDRPKFVRDTWLEYSFGWKPLISDLENATVAFLKSKWTRPIFKMVRGSGSQGTQPKQDPVSYVSAGVSGIYLRFNKEHSSRADVRYYGIVRSTGTGPSSFGYYGFSPSEFVPTLYELIPYSFLVDYFTNLGDIVSSWSYRNIGCEWAARGTKVYNLSEIRNAAIVLEGNPSIRFRYNRGDPGKSSAEYSTKVRTNSVTVPLPTFQWEVPGMQSTKWVNIAALTNQLGQTRRSLAS